MTHNKISAEDKIMQAAYNIFILYGYNGTKLSQIASQAKVNSAAIHNYFCSKERLYNAVVKKVLTSIFNVKFDSFNNLDNLEKPKWFLFTELYNNRILFEHTRKELYPDDRENKLKDLKIRLGFQTVPFLSYKFSAKTHNQITNSEQTQIKGTDKNSHP